MKSEQSNSAAEVRDDIHLEWTYPQSAEEVWECLTNPELIAKWLMPNNFELRQGHKFQFRSQPMPGWCGIVECEVLEIENIKRLKYSWVSGPEAGSKEVDTTVTWQLFPLSDGTRLTLDHEGFKGEQAVHSAQMMRQGWNSGIAKSFEKVLTENGKS